MNRYMRRGVIVLCGFIIALLSSVLSSLMTELDDRNSSLALGAEYIVETDFSHSDVPAAEAHARMVDMNEDLRLGLVKPLRNSGSETFVFLRQDVSGFPESVPRMDGSTSPVAPVRALEHSLPGGVYLVLNEDADVDRFARELGVMGAEVARVERVSVGSLFHFYLLRQPAILFSLLAMSLLLGSVSTYWVGMRGRRRQQEILCGRDPSFLLLREALGVTLPLVVALALGAGVLALVTDHPFVRPALMVLLKIYLCVLVVFFLFLAVGLWAGRHRVASVGDRVAWIRSLRPLIGLIKAAAVACALLSFPWVVSAYRDSEDARQAHSAAYGIESFMGFGLGAMPNEAIEEQLSEIGEVALALQEGDSAVFSYLAPPESVGLSEDEPRLGLANARWLEAVRLFDRADAHEEVAFADLPQRYRDALYPNIWLREGDRPPSDWKYHLIRSESGVGMLPPAMGTLELVKDLVLVEVPSVSVFDDSFLTSVLSSGNVSARDVDEAYRALARTSVGDSLSVYRLGEESVYVAKILEYRSHVMVVSFVILLVCFFVSAVAAGAMDCALHRRRNVLRRLAGDSFVRIALGATRLDIASIALALVMSAGTASVFHLRGLSFLPLVAGALAAACLGAYAGTLRTFMADFSGRKL